MYVVWDGMRRDEVFSFIFSMFTILGTVKE
jgi:hypothetical protein